MINITFHFRCLDVTGKNRRILELPWLYQSVLVVVGHVILVAILQDGFDISICYQRLASQVCKRLTGFLFSFRVNRR